jgi:eukaryotic-like serine/threonine-protein kinase
MRQILAGQSHAHERRFVHRDIKPSNLLVGRDGTKYAAKLADFGLAKNFENAGFSGMTRDGATLGTLAYMAPEQVIDARRANPSVDIYSAGATLYSLIAGRPPHASVQANELILAILEADPEPLDRVNPAASRELARVGMELGSDSGGKRAAVMYTIIKTAKLNGINPEAYLCALIIRIDDHPAKRIAELLS